MVIKARDTITITDETDVESVCLWYTSQSSTLTSTPEKPSTTLAASIPSGWSQTEPAFDQTSPATSLALSVYVCPQTVFKNESDTTQRACVWGEVSKLSSYEAAKAAYNAANAAQSTADAASDMADWAQETADLAQETADCKVDIGDEGTITSLDTVMSVGDEGLSIFSKVAGVISGVMTRITTSAFQILTSTGDTLASFAHRVYSGTINGNTDIPYTSISSPDTILISTRSVDEADDTYFQRAEIMTVSDDAGTDDWSTNILLRAGYGNADSAIDPDEYYPDWDKSVSLNMGANSTARYFAIDSDNVTSTASAHTQVDTKTLTVNATTGTVSATNLTVTASTGQTLKGKTAYVQIGGSYPDINIVCTDGWLYLRGGSIKAYYDGAWRTLGPIYRAYNPNNGDHLLTASSVEYNSLISAGWSANGISFYAFA